MSYLLHLTMLAADPGDLDGQVDVALLADQLKTVAAADPEAVERAFQVDPDFSWRGLQLVNEVTLALDGGQPARAVVGQSIPFPASTTVEDGQPVVSFVRRFRGFQVDITGEEALAVHFVVDTGNLPYKVKHSSSWLRPGGDVDWTGVIPSEPGATVLVPAAHLILVARVEPVGEAAIARAPVQLGQPEAERREREHVGQGARRRNAEHLLGMR
jgi:hypothetical protein